MATPKSKSDLESYMLAQIRGARLPEPVRELCFAPPRRWRFDFAWPELGVALEVDGGTWAGKPCLACGRAPGGRHSSPAGQEADAEKAAEAAARGWLLVRAATAQVEDGSALGRLRRALAAGQRLRVAGAPPPCLKPAEHLDGPPAARQLAAARRSRQRSRPRRP